MGVELRQHVDLGAALRAGVPAGIFATATMDAAMLAASLLGREASTSDRLGPGIIGRWAAGLLRGVLRHDDITREAAVPGETVLGIATHYATGMLLAEAFLIWQRGSGAALPAAVGYGVATAVFPLLVLFPSLGYGWFGLRTGEAARIDRIMLLGHMAFGIGIGIGARRFLPRRGPAT
jgi:hypothetical protein